MTNVKWTPRQALAHSARDRRLIVSAGAGAGKTAVLVERVLGYLADPVAPETLDRLVVVTFTRAAAEELRGRIQASLAALIDAPATTPNLRRHLTHQLALVPNARISTVHSFCLDLITAHGSEIQLPPSIEIMSEEEARLLRADMMARHLEEALADGAFAGPLLSALHGTHHFGDPKVFLHVVSRVLDRIDSMPDGRSHVLALAAEWSAAAAAATSGGDWGATALGSMVRAEAPRLVASWSGRLRTLLAVAPQGEDTPTRIEFVDGMRAALAWAESIDSLDTLRSRGETVPDITRMSWRVKPKSGDPLRALYEAFKKDLNAEADALETLRTLDPAAYFVPRATAAALVFDLFGARLSERLERHCIDECRLPFHMLESLALRLLSPGADGKPSPVAIALRRDIREVLVDEFQDTNPLQQRIFDLVTGPAGEGPSLFFVGDVKQSIYGFRQAAPMEFLRLFSEAAPAAETAGDAPRERLSLIENFRSAPALLAELNTFFADLFSPACGGVAYDESHRFVAGRDVPASDRGEAPVEITILGGGRSDDPEETPNREREAATVAERITAIGPPWNDIAVLVRSAGNTLAPLLRELERRGVPASATTRAGLMEVPEVAAVVALLRAIHNAFDDVALLGALLGPAGRLTENDLLALVPLRGADEAWVEVIDAVASGTRTGAANLRTPCRAFLDALDAWQRHAAQCGVGDLIARLANDLGLLEAAAVRPGGDRRRANVLRFMAIAREFDTHARAGLRRFLEHLDDLADGGDDLAAAPPPAEGGDAVRLMTIHASKGQQFPTVVLAFAGTRFNETDLKMPVLLGPSGHAAIRGLWEGSGAGAIDPVAASIQRTMRHTIRSEEARLLYVALTRARERLLIFGTARRAEPTLSQPNAPPDDAQRLGASSMLDWIEDHCARVFPGATVGEHRRAGLHLRLVARPGGDEDAMPAPGADAATTEARPTQNVDPAAYLERLDAIAAPRAVMPRLRAKVSVSEAKRAHDATSDAPIPARLAADRDQHDWRASGVAGAARTPGVLAGTATHRFLAAYDIEAVSERGVPLARELARLREAGVLAEEEAHAVLLDEIGAFLNSPLGEAMRLASGSVRREVPFTVPVAIEEFGLPPASIITGPVVLQGVIDAWFRPPGAGLVVIDFKTDHCGPGGARVPALVDKYAPQLQLYRLGIERALGERVSRLCLVFLRAGRIVDVPGALPSRTVVESLLRPVVVVAGDPDYRAPAPRGLD